MLICTNVYIKVWVYKLRKKPWKFFTRKTTFLLSYLYLLYFLSSNLTNFPFLCLRKRCQMLPPVYIVEL